jgi:hypothetical protein
MHVETTICFDHGDDEVEVTITGDVAYERPYRASREQPAGGGYEVSDVEAEYQGRAWSLTPAQEEAAIEALIVAAQDGDEP